MATIFEKRQPLLFLALLRPRRIQKGPGAPKTISHRGVSLSPILEDLTASVSIVEALQAREALDISVAHLAIENIKPEDIARNIEMVIDFVRKHYREYPRLHR
jgi:DNA-binding FadR family transcriptional regulator